MSSTLKPLAAQRLLLAGLVGVMALSAFLLWTLRTEVSRGTRAEVRESDSAPAALATPEELGTSAPAGAAAEPERTALPVDTRAAGAADEAAEFDPRVLTGRVLWHTQPVPEAEVRVFPGSLDRRERRVPLASTKSDEEGRFRCAALAPYTRYAVLVQHPQFLPNEETFFAGHDEELELERGVGVAGLVRSADTGAPLAGVTVALERWHFADGAMRALASATSDAEGRWRLAWAAPGIERFLVLRSGALPEQREFQVAEEGGDGYEILLGAGASLEVEVYALENGAVLADTELLAEEARLRTDARGHLQLPLSPGALADGAVRITLALEGGCLTQGRVELEAARKVGVLRVPVARGASVLGRVLDGDGAPIEGAEVRLTGGGRVPVGITLPAGFWLNPPRGGPRSGADGRFTLAGLAPRDGPVEVRAQHPEHPPGRSEPFELASLGASATVEVRLERGATIRGHAALDGKPAPLRIYWSAERANGWTRANDRGDYRIAGVPSGEVNLRPRLDGEDEDVPRREDVAVTVADGEELVLDFALDGGRTFIRGHVRDVHGEPVAEAEVSASLDDEDQQEWLGDEPRAETGPDGAFELAVPDRPGLRFDVSARSGPRSAVAEDVAPGAHEVELLLPALTPIVLRVVDAQRREPVLGFTLYWRESEQGSFARLVQGGRRFSPGPDGTFLAELPAGRLDLAVSARSQGFVPARRDGVELFGASAAPLEFELERGVQLELEFQIPPESASVLQQLQRGRTALASEEQWADRERGGDFFQQEVRNAQAVRVDASGLAHVSALASGTYRFFNGPKGFVFGPKSFELPPVADHRLRVTLEPEAKKKPAGADD